MSEVKTRVDDDDYNVIDVGPTSQNGPRFKAKTKQVTVVGKGGKLMKISIPRPVAVEMKRMFNPGFWDAETLDSPASTPSQYSFIQQIALGTGANQRVGDEVYVSALRIRGHTIQSIDVGNSMAILELIADKQPTSLPRVWANAWEPIGSLSAPSYMNAIPCFDQRFRFKYIDRKIVNTVIEAAYQDTGGTAHLFVRNVPFEFEVKIGKKVKFNQAGNIMSGAELVLFGWGIQTSDTPRAYASYELFFQDA